MVLAITTTHHPATDLGYLLHKNPARPQSTETPFGRANVYYPEAGEERCTAVLALEIDPIGLVRNRRGDAGLFDQYVNDRPYAASSFLSSAIAEMFGTAMGGRSKERPDLAAKPIPLQARIPVLPCRGGESFLRRLFEPLGYEVEATQLPLDENFPDWGESAYFDMTIRGEVRVFELLSHLYLLIPVLDDYQHYWVGEGAIEKLLSKGKGWLPTHPEREEIAERYLRRQKPLARKALARLSAADDAPDPDESAQEASSEEERIEKPISLHELRLRQVHEAIKGAKRVVDLGCGEGRLLQLLMRDMSFEEIVGMDVSIASLERAARRLKLDSQPERVANRIKLLHGSLLYRDRRLEGYDAAAVVEVVEHLDPSRLASFERVVFEFMKPNKVVLTTPNQEYNALFPTLPAASFRHKDHRFEWTRREFEDWAGAVADRHGYDVAFEAVGPLDENLGAPSQMAIFNRRAK